MYYWLVRELPFDDQAVLREFLLHFEGERKLNRQQQIKRHQQTTRDHNVDDDNPIYSRYDTLNRSVNDVGSHIGRFEILGDGFKSWHAHR